VEDRKITAALKLEASQIGLPDDLLERIEAAAEPPAAAVRHGFWVRLRPGRKLELAAACLLLAALIGVAALRNLHGGRAPAGEDLPGNVAGEVGAHQVFSGDSADDWVRVRVVIDQQDGEWQYTSTIENVAESPVNLVYECGGLTRFDGLQLDRSCPVLEDLRLDPGQTKQEHYSLPVSALPRPEHGSVVYRILSEGKQDPIRTLAIKFQEGVRNCCPEPNWQAADVVAKFQAAGLNARLAGESSVKLFGAEQVKTIEAEGQTVVVYVFDSAAAARQAQQTASDPQANTVSWVGSPRFFTMGNLLVQIDFSNATAGAKLQAALEGRTPPLSGDPPSNPDTAPGPNYADVVSAYIPGGPKLPNWRLTASGIKKVVAMLQAAQWVAGDEALPQPSAGFSQPLTLVLELGSGETLTVRMAGDCTVSDRGDGSQVTACQQAADEVLVYGSGRGWRLRAPALARWLAGEWQQDVMR
jgi:hypothetical protein